MRAPILSWLSIYPAGHRKDRYVCSTYGRHTHLPLRLIWWRDL